MTTDEDPEHGGVVRTTVRDRFLAAGISRESFEQHLAAGLIAVAGKRITDRATPGPKPTVVAILLDPSYGEGDVPKPSP